MANNRTEAQAEVTSALVPTLDLTEHKALLNDEILSSTVMRKDVIATETPGGGTVTINYANKDTATAITAGDLVVSFSGIENGDVKYLSITKAATDEITFSGATDVSARRGYTDLVSTLVVYQVFDKNGIIYVNSINIDNNFNDGTETIFISIGDWDMTAGTGSATVNVPHGLSDYKKIRSPSAFIFSDDDAVVSPGGHPLDGPLSAANTAQQGGIQVVDNTNIVLVRLTGGVYDSTDYNATSFNRGYVKVPYLP